jgi:hypothetical protein
MPSDLETRLAKLKGETIQPSEGPDAVPVVDPNENAGVRHWVRDYIRANPDRPSPFDGPNWTCPDQTERENKLYAKYSVQPQPESGYDWNSFTIGRVWGRDDRPCTKAYNYFYREAIPRPRFPNPGEPATMEMWEDFDLEENLWFEASRKFSYVISLIRHRETNPSYFNNESLRLSEELAEYKEFLKGLWAGKGLSAPTDEEINSWVFPEKHKPTPGSGQSLNEYTDCAGNKLYEVKDDS